MKRSTELIHHDYQAPAGFDAVQPGVHKASTVLFPHLKALRSRDWRSKAAYTYGLHGTPTTFTLEARLASLEGGLHTLLAPSGLSALALVNQALLKAGDEVLIPNNAYMPLQDLAKTLLASWGITHQLYDPLRPDDLAQRLSSHTRLVWIEAPGSVTMEFPDGPSLVDIAHGAGALVALDNTWGAGLAFAPFEWGVDISLQALTKYATGGADVLMGSVTTREPAVHERLLMAHMRLGLGVGANDAEVVLKGLGSLPLRYHAQDASARELTAWVAEQTEVQRVLHPAWPSSPGHEHWRTHARAAAGIFSVVLSPSLPQHRVDAFLESLRWFRLGYSWGGPMSLVVPYELAAMRTGHSLGAGHLIRFAVGLEDVGDLRADLEQAWSQLRAP